MYLLRTLIKTLMKEFKGVNKWIYGKYIHELTVNIGNTKILPNWVQDLTELL